MSATSDPRFRKAQWQLIISSMIAYAFFYVTRKNLSMAQPGMLEEGVVTTYQLGLMMTVHGVLYGLSRFFNGFWADRINGRVFMVIGLVLSALANVAFGCTTVSALFAVFWIVNGWTQGMGSPACARMLSRWIHPRDMPKKYSVWNTSHDIGAVTALGVCTALIACGFGWRWCFWVPAALTGLAAVFAWFFVRDSPTEAGLPEIDFGDVSADGDARQVTTADRFRLVFGSRVIWLVALANFFVNAVRFGFLDWGPTFLKEFKGISVAKGGLMIIAFELAAVAGTILSGWITDRVFRGRGVRTCVFFMLFAALSKTLLLALCGLFFACIIGLIFGIMGVVRSKVCNAISTIFVYAIRGVPMLVLAYFVYFGVPQFFNKILGVKLILSSLQAGTICLALNCGAYMAEIIRGGILAVDIGQMEAARSLGLSYSQAMRKVVLPQAIKIMIPSIINQFIITLKDTSILSVIGFPELVNSAKNVIANTFDVFTVWGVVAVMYLIVITILSEVAKYFERRLNRGRD